MRMEFRIEGAAQLEANLATLGRRVGKKVIRQAVRDGQRPMLAAAKANAVSMVGGEMGAKLAKALQIRTPKKQVRGTYSLHVQLKADEAFIHTSKAGKKSYIPAAIEHGHMVGGTFVSPIPVIRSAADSTQGETIRRFTAKLKSGLLREAIVKRYSA